MTINFTFYMASQIARWNHGYFAVTRVIDKAVKEIQENNCYLNILRDVGTFEEEEGINLMAVRKERLALQKGQDGPEVEMSRYLEELGYGS